MGVEPLEMELGLRGLATSVLLGWEGFDLDNLFVLGLVIHPDLGWPAESVKSNLGLSGLVQLLLWRAAAVCWVVKILAALGICSVGLISLYVTQCPEQGPSRTRPNVGVEYIPDQVIYNVHNHNC